MITIWVCRKCGNVLGDVPGYDHHCLVCGEPITDYIQVKQEKQEAEKEVEAVERAKRLMRLALSPHEVAYAKHLALGYVEALADLGLITDSQRRSAYHASRGRHILDTWWKE